MRIRYCSSCRSSLLTSSEKISSFLLKFLYGFCFKNNVKYDREHDQHRQGRKNRFNRQFIKARLSRRNGYAVTARYQSTGRSDQQLIQTYLKKLCKQNDFFRFWISVVVFPAVPIYTTI